MQNFAKATLLAILACIMLVTSYGMVPESITTNKLIWISLMSSFLFLGGIATGICSLFSILTEE